MDFYRLQYFIVVAKYENITQAALELHTSQPALSKIVSQIEDELGVSLFTRQGKSIRLNENGRYFLEYATSTVNGFKDVRGMLADFADGQRGFVSVGTSFPTDETDWIGAITKQFVETHPFVSFSSDQMRVEMLRSALDSFEVDMALTDVPLVDQNIRYKELFTEPIGVLLPARSPYLEKAHLYVEDFVGETFFHPSAVRGMQDLTTQFCLKAGFKPFIRYRGDRFSLIAECVGRGEGVSFISSRTFQRLNTPPMGKKLRFRMLENPYCTRTFGLAVLKNRVLTRAAEDYYSLVESIDFDALRSEGL